ncbi:MAG: ThuA domain-containing protein [Niabella sp.]|nr:ThuA domain-containing protein [Niabella sp.]
MKKLGMLLIGLVLAAGVFAAQPKVLVFYKTAAFHHASIAKGLEAIYKLGVENGFQVDSTKDAAAFTNDNLKQYAAIIFLSTTGTLFDASQQQALQQYVHNHGGIVGIHAAADAEYEWPWYNKLIGAWFLNHPKQQTATLDVVDRRNGATRHLPAKWTRKDEWYNYKDINKDLHVLITLDEKSYEGGKNGDFHPIAWYHNFEGGRVFYTGLGHTDESYSDPLFLNHLLGGIRYAMGAGKKK